MVLTGLRLFYIVDLTTNVTTLETDVSRYGTVQDIVKAPQSWGSHGGKFIIAGVGSSEPSTIYAFDPTTESITPIATTATGAPFTNLAFTNADELVATTYSGRSLVRIDPNGAITPVVNFPDVTEAVSVHRASGDAFVVTNDEVGRGRLYRVNLSTLETSLFADDFTVNRFSFPHPLAFSMDAGTLYYGEQEAGRYVIRQITGFETLLINDLVTFSPDPSSYSLTRDTSGCPNGFIGKYEFDARLSNASQSPLTDLYVQIAELSNGNLAMVQSSSRLRDQGRIFGTGGELQLRTDEWSQTITAGVAGYLNGIQIQFHRGMPETALTLAIFEGANPISGTALFTERFRLTPADFDPEDDSLFTWDLSQSDLYFGAGDVFSFVIQAEFDDELANIAGNDPPGYNGGTLFRNRVGYPKLSDIAFITYVSPALVIGPGGSFPVLRKDGYSEGLLEAGEYVDVPFSICLKNKKRFRLFVDVLGSPVDVPMPLSSWPFDEGADTTVYDTVGSNDGTIYGASWTLGVHGSALSFDGQDDYVQMSKPISVKAMTFSAWVKVPALGLNNRRIYTLGVDGGHYYALQGNSGNALSAVVDGDEVNEYDWSFIPDTWTHIAMSYDGNKIKVYKGGALTETGNISGTAVTGLLEIGGVATPHYGAQIWDGEIDEVMIFDRVLSDAEVRAIYLTGRQ